MNKLLRILIVVLFAVMAFNSAYLSNVVYDLQNRVEENALQCEAADLMLGANLANLARYTTSSPEMIEAVTPTVVYYEMFTGMINLLTGEPLMGRGTGVVIGDGLILTAKHLVTPLHRDGAFACVTLKDGTVGNVVRWAADPNSDIAVLRVDVNTPCVAELADREYQRPGDQVWVIGNPFGIQWTVSAGIVSRTYDFDEEHGSFMVDAPLNPGNSGSPIFDRSGRVIGVATAIIPGNDLGFVVGVGRINEVIEFLIETVTK